MRLTQKQETFCLKYIELSNGSQAVLAAGYKTKNPQVIASQNLTKLNIQSRIAELRQKTEDATVATVQERKRKLTEIMRANLVDFITEGGDIFLEVPHSGALAEVMIEEWRGGEDERASSRTKRIKLYNPIQAIAELNKMEGEYAAEKHEVLTEVIHRMVFILPDGTEVTPKELSSGNNS